MDDSTADSAQTKTHTLPHNPCPWKTLQQKVPRQGEGGCPPGAHIRNLMSIQYCRHIKINGERCGSPALTNELFCYYHVELKRRHHRCKPLRDPAVTVLHPMSLQDGSQRDPILAEPLNPFPRSISRSWRTATPSRSHSPSSSPPWRNTASTPSSPPCSSTAFRSPAPTPTSSTQSPNALPPRSASPSSTSPTATSSPPQAIPKTPRRPRTTSARALPPATGRCSRPRTGRRPVSRPKKPPQPWQTSTRHSLLRSNPLPLRTRY